MGFAIFALAMALIVSAYGNYMSNRGLKADRARRHARFHRVPRY